MVCQIGVPRHLLGLKVREGGVVDGNYEFKKNHGLYNSLNLTYRLGSITDNTFYSIGSICESSMGRGSLHLRRNYLVVSGRFAW